MNCTSRRTELLVLEKNCQVNRLAIRKSFVFRNLYPFAKNGTLQHCSLLRPSGSRTRVLSVHKQLRICKYWEFRSTSSDRHTLRLVCDYVHKIFADSSEFQCLQGIIITWDAVEPAESNEKATFQVAIISDGSTSYAIMQYQKLPWSSSSGIYAQSGFSGKHGTYQANVNSGGPDVKELVRWGFRSCGLQSRRLSNNNEGTSFAFRISGSSFEDPKENSEDYEYQNYDTDYDGNERKAPLPRKPYSSFTSVLQR